MKSEHAHRRGTQDKFVGRVRELLSSRYSEFNGLSVTLYHRAPEPLPPVDSKEGARLAQLVADKLCACIFELRSWGLRQRAVYRWSEGPDHQYVVALIQRHATTDLGKSATLEFSGNFSHLNAHLVLAQAIEKKLAKSYSSFSNGQFWLLVYGDEPFLVEDEAVDHARSFLQSRKHPFDEIWGFFPYAAQELGFPRKVWP